MVVNDPLNPSELRWSESPARLEADGVEPVLRNIVVSFDVNAYRFTTITRIEEEAVRPGAESQHLQCTQRTSWRTPKSAWSVYTQEYIVVDDRGHNFEGEP
jgi:hypothetical protein